MKTSASGRLRDERERLGKNQRDFAALAGISKNTQLAYETGTSQIPLDYLLRLEKLGLDVSYVASGLRTADFVAKQKPPRGPSAKRIAGEASLADLGLTMIPEVDLSYSLGGGTFHEDYVEGRMVPFRRDWLNRLARGFKADVFLSRGQGDSMMPTILDDDDVLVNRADNVVRHQDRIWALGYGELGMIKRVRRLPSGQFQLNSDNPAVSPIEANDDELFVVGRVIWIGRRV